MKTEHMTAIYKKCTTCPTVFPTRLNWETQATRLKTYEADDGSLKQQGNCPQCDSTLLVTLVEALSVAELRRAVRTIDNQLESFNMNHTAHELLRLVRVMWSGDWLVLPDEWTGQQLGMALTEGKSPLFEEIEGQRHALGVTDCVCLPCRRRRLEKQPKGEES